MPSNSPSPTRQTLPHPRRLLNPLAPAILQIRQQQRTARPAALRPLTRGQEHGHVVEYGALAAARRVSAWRSRHHGQDIVYRGAQYERYG
jgi:hypothetical protein